MDPSEEKKQDKPVTKKKSKLIPLFLLSLLAATILGIGLYFYSGSNRDVQSSYSPAALPEVPAQQSDESVPSVTPEGSEPSRQQDIVESNIIRQPSISETDTSTIQDPTAPPHDPSAILAERTSGTPAVEDELDTSNEPSSPIKPTTPDVIKISICEKPVQQLNEFYNTLDQRPYIAEYLLSEGSEEHFTNLIHKLLANPPQVTRESDDLYTILKNTAHFFRVSGKDNILMMKGILDNEKGSIEQVLANYYFLITTPECKENTIAKDIDHAALYEYACFFLNTMGGRLYLFRRDSLSRMVVTYYAVLLVNRANEQNNNLHGIALKPLIDMLIAEMEAGGSSLHSSEEYLDTLYDLKEKYQNE